MKFQELLAGKQINWDRVKLIRHNLTKEEIAANYERGYLELYQSVQNHARFRDKLVTLEITDPAKFWSISKYLVIRK